MNPCHLNFLRTLPESRLQISLLGMGTDATFPLFFNLLSQGLNRRTESPFWLTKWWWIIRLSSWETGRRYLYSLFLHSFCSWCWSTSLVVWKHFILIFIKVCFIYIQDYWTGCIYRKPSVDSFEQFYEKRTSIRGMRLTMICFCWC